jgi:hypothetical protein
MLVGAGAASTDGRGNAVDEPDDELEPVTDPRITAAMEEHELALEDEALEQFPELAKLGTFGDPEFEDALQDARNLLEIGTDAMWQMHDLYGDPADLRGEGLPLSGPSSA